MQRPRALEDSSEESKGPESQNDNRSPNTTKGSVCRFFVCFVFFEFWVEFEILNIFWSLAQPEIAKK